jgi:Fe2+ transport system protein B
MSKRIALVGMPNTGKSTLFNRLTGAGARVGNWPGLTVELLSAKLLLGDAMVELVDLPGLHNLHGFSKTNGSRVISSKPSRSTACWCCSMPRNSNASWRWCCN